jgi:hypothetical protein
MYELQPGDFGYRRKRNAFGATENIPQRSTLTSIGIHWPGEDTASKEELSSNIDASELEDEQESSESVESLPVSGEDSTFKSMTPLITPTGPNLTPQPMGQKLTIYLPPEMVAKLKELKRQRCIQSLSWVVSEGIKEYLNSHRC